MEQGSNTWAVLRAERREYSALKRQVKIRIEQLTELEWGQEQWSIWHRPTHVKVALGYFTAEPGRGPYAEVLYLHAKARGLGMKFSLSFTPNWTRSSVEQIAPTTAQLRKLERFLGSQVRWRDSSDWS